MGVPFVYVGTLLRFNLDEVTAWAPEFDTKRCKCLISLETVLILPLQEA